MMMKKSEDMDKAEESEGPSVSKWVHQGRNVDKKGMEMIVCKQSKLIWICFVQTENFLG